MPIKKENQRYKHIESSVHLLFRMKNYEVFYRRTFTKLLSFSYFEKQKIEYDKRRKEEKQKVLNSKIMPNSY